MPPDRLRFNPLFFNVSMQVVDLLVLWFSCILSPSHHAEDVNQRTVHHNPSPSQLLLYWILFSQSIAAAFWFAAIYRCTSSPAGFPLARSCMIGFQCDLLSNWMSSTDARAWSTESVALFRCCIYCARKSLFCLLFLLCFGYAVYSVRFIFA